MVLPPPPSADPEVGEEWMTTYADAITLLMAFFVLFFSFSRVDLEIFDKVSKGLSASISKVKKETQQDELQENLKDIILNQGADEVVKMGTDAQGSITLELSSGAFFKPGSAELQDQAIPVLKNMFRELASPLYNQFNLNIEGHTDDQPIKTSRFPSNWELSAGRASTVVRFFETEGKDGENKIESNRMRAIGYGQTQPKLANRNVAGEPIEENQIANRRVIIRVNRKQIYTRIKIPKFRRPNEPVPRKAN
ncbi:MAG: OmpA family protein [Rhodospirillales bacterium]|nr:OmpA family protein [Rhodospirillales bacterium]